MWSRGINLGRNSSYLLSMCRIFSIPELQKIISWTLYSSVHEVKTAIPELWNFDSWTSWFLFYELQSCIHELFQEVELIYISSLFVIASLNSWNQYSHTWSLLCGLYDLIEIKLY